jgi:carboxypeptidase Taq
MSLEAYNKLKKIFSQTSISSDIEGILHWDMSTMMPANARKQRSDQLAFMATLKHKLISDSGVDDLFREVDEGSLESKDQANFKEMKREHLFLSALPSTLIKSLSKMSAECEGIWQNAREKSDFNIVKKSLKELMKLTKEEALILADKLNCSPYEALVQKYEPLAKIKNISELFKDLKKFLVPSLDKIIEKQKKDSFLPITEIISPKIQYEIAQSLMKTVGFDFTRGRLDKSQHPFCGGATDDVRITTRYNKSDPFSSLEGVMHETGHAMYELGLPKEWQHQPVGRSRGMAMHESQSLLIEMQITRSFAFKKFLSKLLNSFGFESNEFSTDNLYTVGTRVNKSFIRVEADEVTYPLHIMLRFNIEQMLLENSLQVEDIPSAWNEEYKKLFSMNVDKDSNGCLQDIHWYAGLIGYFPTYSLGALTAAQFANTIRIEIPNLDKDIEEGKFSNLIDWLRINIHEKASFFSTNEILQQVTKSPLNAKYFKEYIANRYF